VSDVIKIKIQLGNPASDNNQFRLDIDTEFPRSGVTAIFGHSGSGKTTLLRCLAGLTRPEHATISVNGTVWQNDKQFLKTHKRPLGYVFQEASLFTHLTGEGNLQYAIKRSDMPFDNVFYDKIINMLGIESALSRYPEQMSGGERQRFAIARALLIRPKVLLMDEPLASLDQARKQEILPYLERLRDEIDIPIVYVSHSMDEIARLADEVIVLEQGKITAQGELTEVFSRVDLPLHLQEQTGVIIKGKVIEQDKQWHLCKVAFNGGEIWVRDNGEQLNSTVRTRILARDVSLALQPQEDSSIVNKLYGTVMEMVPDDDQAMCLVRLKVGNEYIIARLTHRSAHKLGIKQDQQLWVQIKSVAIVR